MSRWLWYRGAVSGLLRTQIAQLRWISSLDCHTIVEIVQAQYFDHSVPFAILAGVFLTVPICSPPRDQPLDIE